MTKYLDIEAVEAALRDLADMPLAERVATLCALWHLTRSGSAAAAAVADAVLAMLPEMAGLPPGERAAVLLSVGCGSAASAATIVAIGAAIVAALLDVAALPAAERTLALSTLLWYAAEPGTPAAEAAWDAVAEAAAVA